MMRHDELKQPLQRRSLMERLWKQRPSALATGFAVLFITYAVGGTWLARQKLPFAGEPLITAQIPKLETINTSPEPKVIDPSADAITTAGIDKADPASQAEADAPVDGEQPRQKITKLDSHVTIITNSRPSLTKAPIAAITEDSPDGPLPKIAANGRKASELYAKQALMSDMQGDGPRIALVIGGMGLSEKLTRKAINDLPANVTFAFAPYGNNLQAQVDRARDGGHEVYLQLPMEPLGYPVNNPGPKTLLADQDAKNNEASLQWLLSRFAGYAGVINYMGGRFLTAPNALRPLLTEIKQRGLNYIEDSNTKNTMTDQVAGSINMPVRHGVIVIDQATDASSIATALDSLEQEAKNGGIAIGTGSGLDVTIDAVRDWLSEARQRGVIIVPVSASFKGNLG
jgi:polysaccharide deacetylase 2 family uncharacterized protein YibQ